MTTNTRHRLLRAVLIVAAGMMMLALAAMIMPRAWIDDVHCRLGLGRFPEQPVAEYLARTTSGLYGLIGVLLFLAASDVVRYRVLARVLVVGIASLAVVTAAFSMTDGMPWWWGAADAASAVSLAVVVLILQGRCPN